MNLPYNQWPGLAGQQLNSNSLFGNLGNALGSTAVPRVMPNLQASLNNVKTRVWGAIVNTTANPTFNRYANNPTTRNTESALSLLRSGMAVVNYINDPNIQALMGEVHQGIRTALTEFDTLYNSAPLPAAQTVHLADLWDEYIKFLAKRIRNHHYNYLTDPTYGRFNLLRAGWQRVLDNNPTRQRTVIANANLAKINALAAQVEVTVVFNETPFST